ncbi:MAG: DUF4147 domain-containing protein [Bdellovibrionales bacterium]|nr:DUF4147 domain-containing protein [Bdellovibrionales bacterium]
MDPRSEVLDLFQSVARALSPTQALGLLRSAGVLSGVLDSAGATHVVAIGKPAPAQMEAWVRVVDPHVNRKGKRIAVGKGSGVHDGDHPAPGPASFAAGAWLLEQVRSFAAEDIAVFLISGGASSLAELPLVPGDESRIIELNRRAQMEGWSIQETNPARAVLSSLKAGGLAADCPARRQLTLWTCDVPGNDARLVGSGPSLFWEPLSLLSARAREALGGRAESADLIAHRARVKRELLSREADFVRLSGVEEAEGAVQAWAAARRMAAVRIPVNDSRGGAEAVAQFAEAIIASKVSCPTLWFSVGEAPFPMSAEGPGRGGRCSEWTLRLADYLAENVGFQTVPRAVGAYATDGDDGNSGLSGGWLAPPKIRDDSQLRAAVHQALGARDSGGWLESIGHALPGGRTETNVMDLRFAIS